jgi:hypothetical protein
MKILRPVRANRAAVESIPKVGTDFSDVEINLWLEWSDVGAIGATCQFPRIQNRHSVSGSESGVGRPRARAAENVTPKISAALSVSSCTRARPCIQGRRPRNNHRRRRGTPARGRACRAAAEAARLEVFRGRLGRCSRPLVDMIGIWFSKKLSIT